MPLMETSGNVTADAYAGGVAVKAKYIEDFFQTWLRTGTGASATVTTGLDASTNKALVWTKSRSAATDHKLTDTVRGATKALISDSTGAQTTDTNGLTAFSATGYTIGSDTNYNNSGATYVDWEFVATPKFFDVVTYTGNGTLQNISHNLGSVPGCIIVKQTDGVRDWAVYHRSIGATDVMYLNLTSATSANNTSWNDTTPTSTQFTVGNAGGASSSTNRNGSTYIAYLFAHNAGGFGLTGTDNVITCGSFTTDGSGNSPNVELGYEPQWIMLKRTDGAGAWLVVDTMRGWVNPNGGAADDANLRPNASDAENINDIGWPYATGFNAGYRGGAPSNWIYIAIRRGPMKVPTDATKVFSNNLETTSTNPQTLTTGFPVDLNISTLKSTAIGRYVVDRLRGGNATSFPFLITNTTAAESNGSNLAFDNNTGLVDSGWWCTPGTINWNFRRAPSFFDEVCYTGTGSDLTLNHNLGVAPEIIIIKKRVAIGSSTSWYCGWNMNASTYMEVILNTSAAGTSYSYPNWFTSAPTSTTFALAGGGNVNSSGATAVAYLFATCAGVSKVFSFTGNGTTQTINCGFTSGARFVLLKATSTTGGWFVYDTARGMTTLTDPYLQLNSTAAETATLGSVTTVTTGFAVNESILTGVNTNGVSYIGLAIA